MWIAAEAQDWRTMIGCPLSKSKYSDCAHYILVSLGCWNCGAGVRAKKNHACSLWTRRTIELRCRLSSNIVQSNRTRLEAHRMDRMRGYADKKESPEI